MPKTCKHPNCNNPVFSHGYCIWHKWCWQKAKPLPKIAHSQKPRFKAYAALARLFRHEHPLCEIKSPVCTLETQGVHHMKGRIGALLLDVRFFKASCNACNRYIERFPVWAKEHNFKQSKFK